MVEKKNKNKVLWIVIPSVLLIILGCSSYLFFNLLPAVLNEETHSSMGVGFFQLTDDLHFSDDEQIDFDFIPLNVESADYLEDYIPLERTVEEYFEIAKIMSSDLWNDSSSDDWQLSSVSTSWDCQYVETGKGIVSFTLFKEIESESHNGVRRETKIRFSAKSDSIYWRKTIYYSLASNWTSYSLEKTIPVESALMIVESKGGKEARENCNSECSVSAIFKGSYWLMSYSIPLENDFGHANLLEMTVSTSSGAISEEYFTRMGAFELTEEIKALDPNGDEEIKLIPKEYDEFRNFNNSDPFERDIIEYFYIAKKINAILWDDLSDDWKLSFVEVVWNCDEVEEGKHNIQFTFYKDIKESLFSPRIRHRTVISFTDSIVWEKSSFIPTMHAPYDQIDLEGSLPSEKILEIVEAEGGSAVRKDCESQCYILSNYWEDQYWAFNYKEDPNEVGALFEIFINPFTGKVMTSDEYLAAVFQTDTWNNLRSIFEAFLTWHD